MKFLVAFAAVLAVAAAFPEDLRSKRSAVVGLAAPGAIVQGAAANLIGPSGIVSANTGAIATNGIHGAVVAPAATVVSHAAVPSVVAAAAVPSVVSHGAVLVGGARYWGGAPLWNNGLVAPGLVAPGLVNHGLGLGLGGVVVG